MAVNYNPGSVEAYIEPHMLIWARKSSGFTKEEAAKAANVSVRKLVNVEEGNKRLTYNQFRRIAKFYGRPMVTFYLAEPPEDFNVPDLRSNSSIGFTKAEGNIQIKIRGLFGKKKFAEEMFDLLLVNQSYDFIGNFNLETPVEVSAKFIRDILQIHTTDFAGYNDSELLRYWRNKIEGLGILIFQFSKIDLEILRGFVFTEIPYPLIAVNAKDTAFAKVFTMVHELTHIILSESSICEPNEKQIPNEAELESYCDAVAGSVIIPKQEFNLLLHNYDLRQINLEQFLRDSSNKFKASYSAILVKLLQLKKINLKIFRGWMNELNSRRRSRAIQEEIKKKKQKSSGPSHYVTLHSKISKNYLNLIRTGLATNLFSFHNAMEYMGEKYNTLTRYFQEVEDGVHKI